MITDKKRPPGRNGGRNMKIIPGRNISNQNTDFPVDLQHLRRHYLSRRHRLSPTFAAAVASFVFAEAT